MNKGYIYITIYLKRSIKGVGQSIYTVWAMQGAAVKRHDCANYIDSLHFPRQTLYIQSQKLDDFTHPFSKTLKLKWRTNNVFDIIEEELDSLLFEEWVTILFQQMDQARLEMEEEKKTEEEKKIKEKTQAAKATQDQICEFYVIVL